MWKPIVIVDEFRQSKLKPFDFIFAPYNDVADSDGLYKVRMNACTVSVNKRT